MVYNQLKCLNLYILYILYIYTLVLILWMGPTTEFEMMALIILGFFVNYILSWWQALGAKATIKKAQWPLATLKAHTKSDEIHSCSSSKLDNSLSTMFFLWCSLRVKVKIEECFVAFGHQNGPCKKWWSAKFLTINIGEMFVQDVMWWSFSLGVKITILKALCPLVLTKSLEDCVVCDRLNHHEISPGSFPKFLAKILIDLADILEIRLFRLSWQRRRWRREGEKVRGGFLLCNGLIHTCFYITSNTFNLQQPPFLFPTAFCSIEPLISSVKYYSADVIVWTSDCLKCLKSILIKQY